MTSDSPSSIDLTGRVAIVTGAGGLLGENHCIALANAGATVIACDLDEDRTVKLAARLGGHHQGLVVDVTKPSSLEELRQVVMKNYGRIDILVNNAAVNDMVENPNADLDASRFEHYPLDLWKRVIDVNLTGVFLSCQILGTEMSRQESGSIINIGSTYGVVAPDQNIYKTSDGIQKFFKSAAYPASKGAVLMLTRFLAAYWGEKGVRVNALSPGGVRNGQPQYFIENYSKKTPLGRMANPTDYMGALVFLASDSSRYVTGHNLLVDGGWTIL